MKQKLFFQNQRIITAALILGLSAACQVPTQTSTTQPTNNGNSAVAVNPSPAPPTVASPTTTPNETAANEATANNTAVTLPVLDAMFQDEKFAGDLKTKLGLTDEQITKLRQTAGEARGGLDETGNGSTKAAATRANDQIAQIIGADKAKQFADFVNERWQNGDEADGNANGNANTGNKVSSTGGVNAVPKDTRIVVNAPAYRMDLYKDGRLVRSYKIGIGYPEFPLPKGMRKAETIIFNPTWTPPDEPWVKGKVKAGEKVEAGSKLNPLGPLKIPIGSPSLIHGGKNPAKLGGFASHGCVGLTNDEVQDVALALAQITGTNLTDADVAGYAKNRTETKNVKLAQSLPVELRYETIVAEDGKLHIYRDVYERGTNTEDNARKVLEAYGVQFDSLSETEKTAVKNALQQMARDPEGNAVEVKPTANANTKTAAKNESQSGSVTRNIVGKKEIVIPIAALNGKGYPAPVDLNVGTRSKKPLNLNGATAATNSNANVANSNQNRKPTR